MSEPPRKFHLHSSASNELERQKERVHRVLEKLSAAVAATDTETPRDQRDIVRRKHVLKAAQQFFGVPPQSSPGPGLDVFVSYAAADSHFARRFVDRLSANRLRCFFAAETIQPAALWMESIWQALRECRVMVFLASPAALQSRWCTLEVGAALAMKKQVVPALRGVQPSELPDYLRHFQAVIVKTADQRDKLIRFLTSLCSE